MTRREQIRLTAEHFLKEHHPTLNLPIPIEDILEIKCRIEVRPLPGLYRLFARNGILLSSGGVIAVDNDDYESNQTRLRFTLAHELGHILLHREHMESVSADDVSQAWSAYNSLSPDDLGRMESDASFFAGHILVPQPKLDEELAKVEQRLQTTHGISVRGKGIEVRDVVAKAMATPFDVSWNVVRYRLEESELP